MNINAHLVFTKMSQISALRLTGAILIILIGLASIIGTGGSGGVIDVVPDLEEPTLFNKGLDTGDMNGDGLIDIVVGSRLVTPENTATNHIDVLLQDISRPGTFLVPKRYAASESPEQVRLADLNGDMALDVMVTHRFSAKSFDVLLQDSADAAQLGKATKFTTVSRPNQIAAGDIDLDGFVDIVVAGETSVAWHPQQASGSFSARNTIGTGVDTVALADLDVDGLLDVATQGGIPSDDVLVYMQRAGLTGAFGPAISVPTNHALKALAIDDLDGDGRLDIAAAGFGSGDIGEFFGVWLPVLQASSNLPTFELRPGFVNPAFNTDAIDTGDLNGDGRTDVILGNFNGGGALSSVEVYLRDDVPLMFRIDKMYLLPVDGFIYAVSIADLNNDLLPDIAVSGDEVFVLFQKPGSPGRFAEPVRIQGSKP